MSDFLIVLALFFSAGLLAVGLTLVTLFHPNFRTIRICFHLAAACAGGAIFVWTFTSIQPTWARLFIAAVGGAAVLVSLTEGGRWLAGRETPQNAVPQTTVALPPEPPYKWQYRQTDPLRQVVGKTFRNEEIPLDGIYHINCTFYNVTLLYNGTSNFSFTGNKLFGVIVKSSNPSVEMAALALQALGLISSSTHFNVPPGNFAEPPTVLKDLPQ